MRLLLVNLIFTLLIFANSGVVDIKIVNGIEYDIVKSEADVIAKYNADGSKLLGKDLAFRNLYGEMSSCDMPQKELKKYNIGDKVMIFFVVTKEERGKQFYKKIYFNKDDIHIKEFLRKKSIETDNQKEYDNQQIDTDTTKHIVRDLFHGGGIYIGLFFVFMALFGTLGPYNRILNSEIKYALQFFIILLFIFGGDNIIRTEPSSCYANPYQTTGKIVPFLNKVYVEFIDCYGHKSRSRIEGSSDFSGNEKGEHLNIYFAHNSGEFSDSRHKNIYTVYNSQEEYDNHQSFGFRFYFGLFLLFLFVYNLYENKNSKKVYDKMLQYIGSDKSVLYPYTKARDKFSELFKVIDKKSVGFRGQNDFVSFGMKIKNNQLMIADGYKWVSSFLILFIGAIFSIAGFLFYTENPSAIIFIFLGIGLVAYALKKMMSTDVRGIFDDKTQIYTDVMNERKIPFKNILGYIITYEEYRDTAHSRYVGVFTLDMVLHNGKIIPLFNVENINLNTSLDDDTEILDDAKMLSSYTQKPIFHFGTIDFRKALEIEKSLE